MKSLQVIAISEPKQDKNGNTFRTFTFQPSDDYVEQVSPATGRVRVVQVPVRAVGGINLYEKSYLPSLKGEPDFGYNASVGSHIVGDIVTRNVENYTIPTPQGPKSINRVTVAVIGVDADDKPAFFRRLNSILTNKKSDSTPNGHVLTDMTAEEKSYLVQPTEVVSQDVPLVLNTEEPAA